jgi:hypothetical protein
MRSASGKMRSAKRVTLPLRPATVARYELAPAQNSGGTLRSGDMTCQTVGGTLRN